MSWAAAGILSAILALLGVGRCSPVAPPADARCEAPADAIVIAAGESIQDAVDAHPEGTSFLLAAGVHRLASVRPRTGNAFYGERDADFTDAIALLERERSALSALTTHQVPLDEIERGFALAADKRTGAIKVTVRCDG